MLTSCQVWLVCETMIVYFLYPETKGPSLEEVAMGMFQPLHEY